MAEYIEGVVQGFRESIAAFAAAVEQASLSLQQAMYGYYVEECRWLQPEQVIRAGWTLYVHPITVRMMRTGEDLATATLAWKLDELEAWALRRHESRCNAADRRGELRSQRAVAMHKAAVERMRLRWRIADHMGVPVEVVSDVPWSASSVLVDQRLFG